MNQRIDYAKQAPDLFRKLVDFNQQLKNGPVEEAIADLVAIRASQINGCAFCLDMHIKQARIHGERELRLHHLAAWRESTLFSPREQAALDWTEGLTRLPDGGVADALYERVQAVLPAADLVALTYLVMTINAWNRVNVAFRTVPGSCDKAFGLDKAGLS